MSLIRTFFMRNIMDDGAIWSSTEELVEPSNFGELDENAYIVFVDIADGKLHSLTIYNGIAGGGLLTSHYSTVAWIIGSKVPLAIGTKLTDILALPDDHPIQNSIYKSFFKKIDRLIQNTTEENRKTYGTPEGVQMHITLYVEPQEEEEEPQPDPVS